MFQTKFVLKVKDSFMFNKFIYRKSCHLWDNIEKYCRPRQATDGNMAHVFWNLDNWDRRHKLRICNIDCFPQQKLFGENYSKLHYTYIYSLIK